MPRSKRSCLQPSSLLKILTSTYTAGQSKLCTDHKPLESIMRKPLHDAPRRLQQLLLRMQRYDVSLEYMPGCQIPLADTLSRTPCSPVPCPTATKELVPCWSIKEDLRLSDTTLEELKQEASSDPDFQDLLTIRCGWPSEEKPCVLEYSAILSVPE